MNEVDAAIREMNRLEKDDYEKRVAGKAAFSTKQLGGITYKPVLSWCIIKLTWDNTNPKIEFFENKSDAIETLNQYHVSNGFPEFSQLSDQVREKLIFEAPNTVAPYKKNEDLSLLNHDEQKDLLVSEILTKLRPETMPRENREAGSMVRKWYPDAQSAIEDHRLYLITKVQTFANEVQQNIGDYKTLENKRGIARTTPPSNWLSYVGEKKASTVEFLHDEIPGNNNVKVRIATVLSVSHPILDTTSSIRKPINSNEYHGVFTESNPTEVIKKMAEQGFDNQPIFCNIENRCVATLRLQDSLKFLRNGNFEIQDFKDYHNLIKLGFLTNPPPLLDASESVEQAISLFSTGCEAVLFNFNKKLWNYFGHDDTASNVLNDGLHIMTPHDVATYFMEKG